MLFWVIILNLTLITFPISLLDQPINFFVDIILHKGIKSFFCLLWYYFLPFLAFVGNIKMRKTNTLDLESIDFG